MTSKSEKRGMGPGLRILPFSVTNPLEKCLHISKNLTNFWVHNISNLIPPTGKDNVFETAAELGKQGFYCTVISIEDYAKMRIYSIKRNFSINEFVNLMLHFAQEINAKDETIQWIKDCAIEFAL